MAARDEDFMVYDDKWTPYGINWTAIVIGALAAIATALIFGLFGIAIGAQVAESTHVDDEKFRGVSVVFGILGAFLSFVVGGWVAGRIAGIRRSEPTMLHGAISWLVAVPLLVILAAMGGGSLFGWFDGLHAPQWGSTVARATADAEELARDSATGAATALLMGLMGSVIGGWMASGEPMTLTYHRQRDAELRKRGTAPFAGTTADEKQVAAR